MNAPVESRMLELLLAEQNGSISEDELTIAMRQQSMFHVEVVASGEPEIEFSMLALDAVDATIFALEAVFPATPGEPRPKGLKVRVYPVLRRAA